MISTMMGRQSGHQQRDLFVPGINLDLRVRSDHPLRKIAGVLDLSFVHEEVARLYGRNGNPSVDPVVIVKMMLLLFLDNVSSERELMRIIPERLDYLWFLGYEIDDLIPDHSVLSKARKRWGAEVFETIFIRTVQQCVEAGLVDGKKIHIDSSLIDANASNNSIVRASPELISSLKEIFHREERKLESLQAPLQEPAPSSQSQPKNEPDELQPEPATKAVSKAYVSTTDPSADVVNRAGKGSRARYKNHRAVDDAYGVVTAVKTTGAWVADNQMLSSLVEVHRANTKRDAQTVVADSIYGTVENFIACQQQGIRTHMSDLAQTQEETRQSKGIFHESAFKYCSSKNIFICPAGQEMHPSAFHSRRQTWHYRAGKAVCNKCPLRKQCTTSKSGRSIHRYQHQALLDKGRLQSKTASARRDRRRRKHLMEGSFADAANNHGFKRARWRGLWKQSIQDYMIAAAQNLRLLTKRRERKSLLPANLQMIALPTWQVARGVPPATSRFWLLCGPIQPHRASEDSKISA